MDNKHADLDAAIAALPVTYSAAFVPQSLSRNAGEKNHSLNWRVTLARKDGKGEPFATDFMQGIGYVPGEPAEHKGASRNSVLRDDYFKRCAEDGRYSTGSAWARWPIPAPALRDVLYCLVSDTDALDAGCFEDWAADLGMDPDSRKAEDTYRQCVATGRELRALIGDIQLRALRALFQDY